MTFSAKNYNPATGDDGFPGNENAPSGAYLFKVKNGDMEKHSYGVFEKIETYKSEATGIE